jgi:DNA polymerase-3 subunit delta'
VSRAGAFERAFEGVLSQGRAIAILNAAMAADRLASAYLFEGPSGVGKQRTAMALARAVVSGDAEPSGRAEIARRIDALAHPDVRVFAPREEGSGNLQVETVRQHILPFTQFAPFEAKHAFLIFPDADVSLPEAHPEAANALLKTLEEPRPGVHFILLAERPDRLLTTIRSRCQRLRFSELPDATVDGILERAGVEGDRRTAAVALAEGRADRALELSVEGAADALLALAMRVDAAAAAGRPGDIVLAAEEVARFEPLSRALDALARYYRDVAAAALGRSDASLAFRHRAAEIRARGEQLGAARAARACELLRVLDEQLAGNANKEIALGALFSSI